MKTLLLRVWYSITARLVVLFLLVGGCGFILFLTLFRLYSDTEKAPLSYPVPFLRFLTEQLPTDPKPTQISRLMNETIYALRVQGAGQTGVTIPAYASLKMELKLSQTAAYYCSTSGSRYLVLNRAGRQYIFGYRFKGQEDNAYGLVVLLIPLMAILLLLLGYFIAGRFFIPINWIRKGAVRIGEGDLSYRIPYQRKDELGQLVAIVNQMAEDLERIFDSKRQLLLSISHELRTPIARMKLNVALLDESAISHRLNNDIDEMEDIVEGLLDSERLQGKHTALDKVEVDAAGLIADIIGEYEASDGVVYQAQIDALPMVLDVAKIKFLVRNLISNAIKYTWDKNRHIHVKLEKTENHINLSVADNGCGIGEAHLDHVFSPFYRADHSRGRLTGGVGLGLYLCLLIAKAHGGDITVRSIPDSGSCFCVSLPLDDEG
ncbi:MAG: HAMP domain-containing histidine kinase [Algicola sp.]|nr:HAMP domain-containing histidine kinase [Algicola sp.]